MNGKIGNIIFGLVIVLVVGGIAALIYIKSQDDSDKSDNTKQSETAALNKDTENQQSIGNKDSKVKVVEFGDFKCPHCRTFDQDIFPKLKKDFIDSDKIEYRYVTAPFHGESSALASKASHAVYKHAKDEYWTFHHEVYAAAPESPEKMSQDDWLTTKLLDKLIDDLKISKSTADKIKSEYKDDKSDASKAQSNEVEIVNKHKVNETPSVYVNGKRVSDVFDYNAIKKEVETALDK